ncbi:MAG: FliH/SctL family protein [Verrucomicrobiae bacterium]|nr:FliH/SctL family protein [Verrucomicrobiae bacterium]
MAATAKIILHAAPQKLTARWLPPLDEASPQEQGFLRGYTEGWEKAQEDCRRLADERYKTSRAHWDAVAQSLNQLPKNVIQQLREGLAAMTFQTVRRILAATPITREEIAAHVNQMLEHVEASSQIEIQLHPQDLELLTAEDLNALRNENLSNLKWTPSPSVPRGGCIIQGDFGWVDGRRETRIAKLEQAALNAVRQET